MRRSCEDALLEGSSLPFRLVAHLSQDESLSLTINPLFYQLETSLVPFLTSPCENPLILSMKGNLSFWQSMR